MSEQHPSSERRCIQCGHLLNGWAWDWCSDWCRRVWYGRQIQ